MEVNNPKYSNQGIHVISTIFTIDKGVTKVLLIKRKNNPYKDYWALVGGALYNDELLIDYFRDCARDVYNSGYQVAYCIHTNQKKHNDCKNHAFSHLHLGINSVNYENGKKFHATKGEIIRGNEYETDKLNSYKEASAVRFKNIDEYRKREIENIK